jgi:hypothetical protein
LKRSSDKHDTSPTNPVTAYALAVRDGAIVAGHALRQACARHLRDLDDGPARGLRFSRAAVERVLRFFSALRLAEGVQRRRALQALALAGLRYRESLWLARSGRVSALP